MPTQKKIIIGTRKNLIEATVHNRSEVVEYLQQHNWHLDRETFIRVAPDEYCLVSKSALTPDMDIVDEKLVCAWSTAETAELKELRAHNVGFIQICRFLQIEIIVMMLIAIAGVLMAWKTGLSAGMSLLFLTLGSIVMLHTCMFSVLSEVESGTKNGSK